MALAFLTLISEDLACISAGLLVAQGCLHFFAATFACFVGIYIGDLLLYALGKYVGQPLLLRKAPIKWFLKGEDITRSTQWLSQKGPIVIFISRFLPGTRFPTYVTCGLLHMNFWRFSGYFCLASSIWTPLLVSLSMVIGATASSYFYLYQQYALITFMGLALFIWIIAKTIIPLFNYKGRRLLISAWQRKIRWEFWSPWIFYFPLVIYVLYLGIKHRCLTLFTAANPGMYAGGVIGESKYAILKNFSDVEEYLATTHLIKASATTTQRLEMAFTFMNECGLNLPIVLKPNIGQRGVGVSIIRSRDELEASIVSATEDMMIQEHVVGYEYGVFYYRFPGQEKGQIFSITDKRFSTLIGDGQSTVEELILKDKRAVCMAPFFLNMIYGPLLSTIFSKAKILKSLS